MIINEAYEIGIKIENVEFDIDPRNFSLILRDSIHSFYNSATLQIEDMTGLFKETLLSCEGNIYDIYFASKLHDDIKLSSKFVIISDETNKQLVNGLLSNDLTVNFTNAFYDTQEVETKAHVGDLSSITKKCVSDYFTNVDVDKIDCNSTWYQFGCDVKTFLEKTVLENAYSKFADNYPFYMFISNNDKFNFKSFKGMVDKGSIATLRYAPQSSDTFSENSILDIKPYKTGSAISKKYRNREVYTRDYESGNMKLETINIKKNLDFGQKIPIIGSIGKVTDLQYFNFTQKKQGEKEALRGRVVQHNRKEFFIDRHIITTPFNPKLISGSVVDLALHIPSSSKNSSEIALYQSGQYLIEESTHEWNGKSQSATTTLIVGRKSCNIPNFKLSGKLI